MSHHLHLIRLALVGAGAFLIAALTLATPLGSYSRAVDLGYITGLALLVVPLFLGRFAASVPRPWRCSSGAFAARLGWAAALNLLYWAVIVEPHFSAVPPYWLGRLVALIDLPVSVAALVPPLHGLLRHHIVDVFMQSFSYGTSRFCFGVPPFLLWPHLALAVPTWLALLYLPWHRLRAPKASGPCAA